MKTHPFLDCLSRLDRASWSKILFGDDPWAMLLLLTACGLGILVLAREALPAILGVVLVGLLVHAWLWCRATAREAAESDDSHGRQP
jgi:hypothetical protein